MVDAQASNLAFAQQTKEQRMGGIEHFLSFHLQRHEAGDVKEPAIIDLLGTGAPKFQSVMLPLRERGEKASSAFRGAIDHFQCGWQSGSKRPSFQLCQAVAKIRATIEGTSRGSLLEAAANLLHPDLELRCFKVFENDAQEMGIG